MASKRFRHDSEWAPPSPLQFLQSLDGPCSMTIAQVMYLRLKIGSSGRTASMRGSHGEALMALTRSTAQRCDPG
eukprot:10503390-Lingulodinium_polyedra.AAC.1